MGSPAICFVDRPDATSIFRTGHETSPSHVLPLEGAFELGLCETGVGHESFSSHVLPLEGALELGLRETGVRNSKPGGTAPQKYTKLCDRAPDENRSFPGRAYAKDERAAKRSE